MNQLNDKLERLREVVELLFHQKIDRAQEKSVVRDFLGDVLLDAFNQVVEERHKLDEVEQGEENCVIHYTSIASLVSMLEGANEGASLRLYDSTHFNDPDEGNFFGRSAEMPSRLDHGSLKETYSSHAYIASFIIQNDEKDMGDNLVFWRTYGNEGMGCSLKLPIPRNQLLKVLYGRDEAKKSQELLNLKLNPILKCLAPLSDSHLTIDDIWQQWAGVIGSYIDKIRYLYKSEAYEYEQECRLIIPEVSVEKGEVGLDPTKRNQGAFCVRHYHEVEELKVKNIFTSGSSITLGPRVLKPDDLIYCLKSLLERAGLYGPDINVSKIPYQAS